jgi:hypothetical protein
VDRQPHPRHSRRRKDRLPSRHSRHEPPTTVRLPTSYREDKGGLLQDTGPERCRCEMSTILTTTGEVVRFTTGGESQQLLGRRGGDDGEMMTIMKGMTE